MAQNFEFNFPETMNLRLAAVFLDMSAQRIRTLVREGKIEGASKGEGGWAFTKAGLEAYKQTAANTPRAGGARGKSWLVKIPAEKLEAAKAALAELGLELAPRYNYAKQREYQAKRKVAKAAEKAAQA
jgi:hypothetical protein